MTTRWEALGFWFFLALSACGESARSDRRASRDGGAEPNFRVIKPVPEHVEQARAAQQSLTTRVTVQRVSDDGSVAIGASLLSGLDPQRTPGEWHAAFRWTADTGTVSLGFLHPTLPNGLSTEFPPVVLAMTPSGSVLAGTAPFGVGVHHAFVWTEAQGLLDISPAGTYSSAAASFVSDDGSVVVGSYDNVTSDGAGLNQTFRWTREAGAVALGALPGHAGAIPLAMSGDGSVILGTSYELNVGSVPFRWTAASGMTAVSPIPGCENYIGFSVQLVSYGPVMIGTCPQPASAEVPFVHTDAMGLVGLGLAPGIANAAPHAASRDGSVVVGVANAITSAPVFRWTSSSGTNELLPLPESAAPLSDRKTMSADGSVVVGKTSPGGFRWSSQTGLTSLASLDGAGAPTVIGVSGDGLTIVGSIPLGLESDPIVWTTEPIPMRIRDFLWANQVREVPVNSFSAADVGQNGRILYGTADTGEGDDGWVAYLPP